MGSCVYYIRVYIHTLVYTVCIFKDNDVLDNKNVEYIYLTITGLHCVVLARLTFLG